MAALDGVWRGAAAARGAANATARQLQLRLIVGDESALHGELRRSDGPLVYLLVSHHHLDRPVIIARLKERCGTQFACLVHDLIPMEFPEYARPGQAERHARRMTTAARLSDAVIVNSDDTRVRFEPLLRREMRNPRLLVAPLGIDLPPPQRPQAPRDGLPYFVCVGTIEPKKNHLLLLNLWRRLAAELGARTPRLVLVGARGWEIENVADMIERSLPLRHLVDERGAASDAEMVGLLSGARALLMPSFAEGYGLPVAEALNLGLPVLCSDLACLRGVGGDVAEYLDPLDGPAWRQAIVDYAEENSPRRAAQLARLAAWRAPTWENHFAAVEALLDGLGGE